LRSAGGLRLSQAFLIAPELERVYRAAASRRRRGPRGGACSDEIRKRCFTVIVSDYRMPDIDGVALLNQAASACPRIAPIMLSGDAEAQVMSRAVPTLRQLIAKPCDAATLRDAIQGAIEVATA
jgi:DNA-binding NtrC family response regulator